MPRGLRDVLLRGTDADVSSTGSDSSTLDLTGLFDDTIEEAPRSPSSVARLAKSISRHAPLRRRHGAFRPTGAPAPQQLPGGPEGIAQRARRVFRDASIRASRTGALERARPLKRAAPPTGVASARRSAEPVLDLHRAAPAPDVGARGRVGLRASAGRVDAERLRQLAGLVHLGDDVAAADQLAADEQLRDRRPARTARDSSWRMRGSGRMSTAANGAPSACSAATVRAEKPHAGCSGVPFMKRITSLSLIASAIASRMGCSARLAHGCLRLEVTARGSRRRARRRRRRRRPCGAARCGSGRRTRSRDDARA